MEKGKAGECISQSIFEDGWIYGFTFGSFQYKAPFKLEARMEQVAWKKEQKISEYEAAKKAVSDFMQYMESGEHCEVFYDKQQEGLMYQRGETILPVMSLSAGYQSLI